MGAGGLTSHLAAGPVSLPTLREPSKDMFQTAHEHALSARSLPEVSPYRHLKGGSERVLSVHARDSPDVHRNLKSLSFRAPIFGKHSPEKIDMKSNTKYCNEEIMKGWLKDKDGVPGENAIFPISDDEHATADEDSWNGTIRRTQSL